MKKIIFGIGSPPDILSKSILISGNWQQKATISEGWQVAVYTFIL